MTDTEILNMYCEIMSHIAVIEDILQTYHSIGNEEMNRVLQLKRDDIREQLYNKLEGSD